jgi:chromosome segregation ATPase
VRRTRRDSERITDALRDLVAQAEASSQVAFDDLGEANSLLTARFEQSLVQVDTHRAKMEELLVSSEQRGEQTLERLDALVADVGDRVAEVTQRLDEVANRHEQELGRATAQATDRIAVAEQAVVDLAAEADAKIAGQLEEVFRSAERDAEALRDQARAKLDEDFALVEAESREELHRVMERVREELERSGAQAEELRARRQMIEERDEELVEARVESARAAWQRVAEEAEGAGAPLQVASQEASERVASRVAEVVAQVDVEDRELRVRSAAVQRQVEELEAQSGVAGALVEELEARAGVADARVTALAAQLDAQSDELTMHSESVSRLLADFETRTYTVQRQGDEVEALGERVHEMHARVDELETELEHIPSLHRAGGERPEPPDR